MSTWSDEILDAFVQELVNNVGCWSHKREVKKNYCLKKCNSGVHGKMGQIAAVANRTTLGHFEIDVKTSLVDDWCLSQGKLAPQRYGRNPGLPFFVNHGSTLRDPVYQTVMQVLQIAKSHPSLPPC